MIVFIAINTKFGKYRRGAPPMVMLFTFLHGILKFMIIVEAIAFRKNTP